MCKKKRFHINKKENDLYASVKKYVHEKTNIDINYINVYTATRIQKESTDLWEDFSIIFKDLLTNKIFRLEKSVLYEEIEENVQL